MRKDTIAEAVGVESLNTVESLFDEDNKKKKDLVAVDPMSRVLAKSQDYDDDDDDDDDYEQETQIIESTAREILLPEPVHLCEDDKILDAELGYAQENIKSIIEKGKDAVDDIISIATDSENPKAYSSVAGLMKTLTDMNKSYIDVAIKRNSLRKGQGVNGKPEKPFGQPENGEEPKTLVQNNTVNNNVIFQGSLQDILDRKKQERLEKQNAENVEKDVK